MNTRNSEGDSSRIDAQTEKLFVEELDRVERELERKENERIDQELKEITRWYPVITPDGRLQQVLYPVDTRLLQDIKKINSTYMCTATKKKLISETRFEAARRKVRFDIAQRKSVQKRLKEAEVMKQDVIKKEKEARAARLAHHAKYLERCTNEMKMGK